MTQVVVVDLGMGNLRSVARALERAGARVTVSSEPSVIAHADRVVVPGQGHFRDCARAMHATGLGDACRTFCASGRPYLGLCLGMQILFEQSDEAPEAIGLGMFEGAVRVLRPGLKMGDGRVRKIPHMGWNEVTATHPLLPPHEWFYFVHSFHCVPRDPTLTVATVDYGESLCAAVARDNILACQFHPEKSHEAGERVLKAFVGGTSPWS